MESSSITGIPWIVVAIGIAVVACAMVFGIMNSRRKTVRDRVAQAEGTKQIYRDQGE